MYKPRSIQPVQWRDAVFYLLLVNEYDDWLFAHDAQRVLTFATPAEALALAQPHLDYWRGHPAPDEDSDEGGPDDFIQADLLNLDEWHLDAPSQPMTPELARSRLQLWGLSKSLVTSLRKLQRLGAYAPLPNHLPVMEFNHLWSALVLTAYPALGDDSERGWLKGDDRTWGQIQRSALEVWALALKTSH